MHAPLSLVVALLLSGAPEQTSVVRWTGQRLTVQALNAPLRPLLEEVAKKTGIVLSGADRVTGTHTVDVRDVYLTEALQQLLEHVNFFVTQEKGLFHVRIHSMSASASNTAPTSPVFIPGLTDKAVGQHNVGQPDPIDPDDQDAQVEEEERQLEEQQELESLEKLVGARTNETLDDLSTAMTSDHAAVRIRALHLLAARAERDAFEEILSAFADNDANVALTASDLLASIPSPAALEILTRNLESDLSAEIQLMVLRSLALRGDPSSIPAVRRVASEGDPAVREVAGRLAAALQARAKAEPKPKS